MRYPCFHACAGLSQSDRPPHRGHGNPSPHPAIRRSGRQLFLRQCGAPRRGGLRLCWCGCLRLRQRWKSHRQASLAAAGRGGWRSGHNRRGQRRRRRDHDRSQQLGRNLWDEPRARAGDSRAWQPADFVNNQLPNQLDGVSVTVGGKSAFVYYISPTQVNILTPPDPMTGSVQVQLTNNARTSAPYTAQAQSMSPSFFIFGGGPYPPHMFH